MKLLGDRGAAQHGAALEHADGKTRGREIGGAGEAVVPAADDDGVEACGAAAVVMRWPWRACRERASPRTAAQSSLSPAATMENPLST